MLINMGFFSTLGIEMDVSKANGGFDSGVRTKIIVLTRFAFGGLSFIIYLFTDKSNSV